MSKSTSFIYVTVQLHNHTEGHWIEILKFWLNAEKVTWPKIFLHFAVRHFLPYRAATVNKPLLEAPERFITLAGRKAGDFLSPSRTVLISYLLQPCKALFAWAASPRRADEWWWIQHRSKGYYWGSERLLLPHSRQSWMQACGLHAVFLLVCSEILSWNQP